MICDGKPLKKFVVVQLVTAESVLTADQGSAPAGFAAVRGKGRT
jgi:hypothetical protein